MTPTAEGAQRPAPAELPAIRGLMARFNIAFSLMSVIPLLTCCYLITVRFFSITILQGMNGVYFLLALVIALLGLLAGQQLVRDIFRKLVDANRRLAQHNERQAAFVANVAHEFRAPLAVFKGAMDNLADELYGPLTVDQREPVLMCQREANRLKRLVGDLLDLTRIQAGRLEMRQEAVVIQELLKGVGEFFAVLLQQQRLRLALQLAPKPLTVTGDRDRLQQVFINLVGNAIKFTELGGIEIHCAPDGESCRVHVVDSGRGIADEDLERIFDKFERVGTQSEEGSGLGLPIAREIVQLHGGRLWAESELGKGSRFIVQLPLAKGAR